VKYLLDTSVLLHSLSTRPRLNQRAMGILADESSELYFSAASSWEMVIKAGIGKLILPEAAAEFVARAMRLMSLRPLEISHLHALAIASLPDHHRDPFDRMLIAQAVEEGMTVLTEDRVFEKYRVEQVFCGR
jgi:PIN domain nuclease of toxin-antitoxin system